MIFGNACNRKPAASLLLTGLRIVERVGLDAILTGDSNSGADDPKEEPVRSVIASR
jgi:hypothetical protein